MTIGTRLCILDIDDAIRGYFDLVETYRNAPSLTTLQTKINSIQRGDGEDHLHRENYSLTPKIQRRKK